MQKAKFVCETSGRANKILGSALFTETPSSLNTTLRSCYFDSFMYTDHLSKNKLSLQLRSPLKEKIGQKESYESCFSLMKKTKNFHMNEVKDRNYRQICEDIRGGKFQEKKQITLIKQEKEKKYAIRKCKQREQYRMEKDKLNNLLSRDGRFLHQSQNISPDKSRDVSCQQFPCSFISQKEEKNTIPTKPMMNQNLWQNNTLKTSTNQSIMGKNTNLIRLRIDKKIQKDKKGFKKSKLIQKNSQQMSQSDRDIVQKFNRELRHEVTKNIQFLVDPNSYKLINKIKDKRIRVQNDSQNWRYPNPVGQFDKNRGILSKIYQQFEKCSFNLDNLEQVPERYKTKRDIQGKQSPKKCEGRNKLIRGIKDGNYFLVQIQLSVNPSLLLHKESKTLNNLLHLCIKHNQSQIFFMIIKKCEQNRIGLLFEQNKYKKNPLQVLKIYKHFYEKCKNHKQFLTIEQHLKNYNFSIK